MTHSVHPVDDRLRAMMLQCRTGDGRVVSLEMPWDKTPFDLEPVLVAGQDLPDRTVHANAVGDREGPDLTEVALGKALGSSENPQGPAALEIHVASGDRRLTFTVTCMGLEELQSHRAYPRARNPTAEGLVKAYLLEHEDDWFCDASSTLACCEMARTAPEQHVWVTV